MRVVILLIILILVVLSYKFRNIRENFETYNIYRDRSAPTDSLYNLGDENIYNISKNLPEYTALLNKKLTTDSINIDMSDRGCGNNSSKYNLLNFGKNMIVEPKKPNCELANIENDSQSILGTLGNITKKNQNLLENTELINKKIQKDLETSINRLNSDNSSENIINYTDETKNNLNISIRDIIDKVKPVKDIYTMIGSDYKGTDDSYKKDYNKLIIDDAKKSLRNNFISKINSDTKLLNSVTNNLNNKIENSIRNNFNDKGRQLTNNQLKDKFNNKEMTSNIVDIIDGIISNDPMFGTAKNSGLDLEKNDMVYFTYTLPNNNPDYGVEGNNKELIIGGRICSIDYIRKSAKLNYLIIINPNPSQNSKGKQINNSTVVNFDIGVDGYPKWYVQTTPEQTKQCGVNGPNNNYACLPNQWDSKQDEWISKYITQFDRKENKLICGGSPTSLNIPSDIPLAALSKTIQGLISEDKLKISRTTRIFNINYVPNNNSENANKPSQIFSSNGSDNLPIYVNNYGGFQLYVKLNITDNTIYGHNGIDYKDSARFAIIGKLTERIHFICRYNNRLFAMFYINKTPIWYMLREVVVYNPSMGGTNRDYVNSGGRDPFFYLAQISENIQYIFRWELLENRYMEIDNRSKNSGDFTELLAMQDIICKLNSINGIPASCENLIQKYTIICA